MNSRQKKLILWLVILVFLTPAIILARNILKPPSAPIHTVRVMESVRSPYFLPQYLALNLGFFEEQNLVVKISTASPGAIHAALLDGRADIALCGLQKIVFSPQTQTSRPKIFAAIAKKDGSLLLSRKDPAEFQWKNLKNKTIISGSQDDSSVIALEDVLRNQGLPPFRAVTIYYNIPAKLRMGAFRAGTGHYIQLLEPDASIAEREGYGRVAASIGQAAGDMVVTAYAALPDLIASKPEVIQQFTNAVYKALLWLDQHSAGEAADAALPSFPNLDREILINSIERYRSLGIWTCDPMVSKDSFERFQMAASKAGEISGAFSYETIFVSDFAGQAVATVAYDRSLEEEKAKKRKLFKFFKTG
ncbi:MAG: NMT1/THI5 like protein [Firmicutes bacterium ADurb.Bin456]|nr:MAG: NMT1/THI5 like protein [Firmicutes bacterium ADurb.Bin456]